LLDIDRGIFCAIIDSHAVTRSHPPKSWVGNPRFSLVVIAAGNEGLDLDSIYGSVPAQLGLGLAVSATGPLGLQNPDRFASYGNYGRSVVDVAAPGGDFALYPASNYVFDMVLSPGDTAPCSGNPAAQC
jgi:subtilisin family serine protease